ncbi:hypothetical protein ACFWA1_35865 [Streptomyces sp. NPDC060005]|uniref:hypothetical protein n=1 Tax=Streptomyces sp. NPDC060005 TaxID=3347034 RepID=UPI0036C1301B
MIRTAARRIRSTARTVSDAVRSVVAPASLVRSTAPAVPDPADVFTDEDMPSVEDIETTAAPYTTACDKARAGERGKRKARKLLDRLPAGTYGRFTVERAPSSRQTPDLESIRATYARLGLGPVPMRSCSPSLRITEAVADVVPLPVAEPALGALAA